MPAEGIDREGMLFLLAQPCQPILGLSGAQGGDEAAISE
jgi:hypothetical protein